MKKLVFLATLTLTGCLSPSLSVRTLYGSAKNLPSVKEDTPDPLKQLQGRHHILSINWSSPTNPAPLLSFTFRFADETLIKKNLPLEGRWGLIEYEIDQALFRTHGSLVSYRICLMHHDKELTASEHKLWVTPIEIQNI